MNDDVEGFYTNPIPKERRSRWLSRFNREVFGGAFRYRIGIGVDGIVVQNLIVYGMERDTGRNASLATDACNMFLVSATSSSSGTLFPPRRARSVA